MGRHGSIIWESYTGDFKVFLVGAQVFLLITVAIHIHYIILYMICFIITYFKEIALYECKEIF